MDYTKTVEYQTALQTCKALMDSEQHATREAIPGVAYQAVETIEHLNNSLGYCFQLLHETLGVLEYTLPYLNHVENIDYSDVQSRIENLVRSLRIQLAPMELGENQ